MRLVHVPFASLIALSIVGARGASPFTWPAPVGAPGALTIASMNYLQSYRPGDTVRVFRGIPADIAVNGHLVDLSTGVEARTSGGSATSVVSAFAGQRQGGDNASIVVGISSSPSATLGVYQVLIHYLVEASGPDKFLMRLYDHGQVDNLSIVEPPEPTGVYLTGKSYTLRVLGQQLTNAALFVARTGIPGLSVPSTGSGAGGSATSLDIPIRFANGGSFTLDATDFVDAHLSPPPSASGCTDECYAGSAQLHFQVVAVPVIASISSTTPAAGSSVSISGTALTSPGLSATISGLVRYGNSSGHATSISPSASGNNLAFTALANLRQDSLSLDYRVVGAGQTAPIFRVPLPFIAVQGGTPLVIQLDSLTGAGGMRHVLVAGTRTMLGQFVAPYPLFPTFTLVTNPVVPAGLPTGVVPGRQVTSPVAPAPPASPTITFGQNDLIVSSSRYFPSATHGFTVGVDSVTFGMIGFTDTIAKTLTVTTPFGSTTVSDVLAVPAPTIAFIRRRFSDGQTSPVTDGALIAGATYDVGGIALILTAAGKQLQAAAIKLNGLALTQTLPAVTPGAAITFIVPSSATSGALTATTIAGTASRPVTVQPPPAPLTIVGVQLSPNPVVGGQPVTATIALNAPVASGATAGTLVFTQSATGTTVALPAPIAIHSNPVIVQIPTHVTRTALTSNITVANPDATGSLASGTTSISVVPPSPTSLTLGASSVVGGQPVTATVQMSGAAALSDSVTISMTTDDPTTATVPATIHLNGTTATLQIATHVVPTSRTVTVSATSGGQTRSATLAVAPPTVSAVSAQPASTIGPSSVPVSVTLTAPLPATGSAAVTCTGQGLTCPATVSLSGSSGSFTATVADVPTERTGTITVTFNGVSTSGTIDMQPVGIQSMTVSPPSVHGGTGSSLTVQLNHTTTALTFHFTSSDPTVLAAPPNVTLAGGQLTQLVSLTTLPQSATKSVTITATTTRPSAFGFATITGTATLTVTP